MFPFRDRHCFRVSLRLKLQAPSAAPPRRPTCQNFPLRFFFCRWPFLRFAFLLLLRNKPRRHPHPSRLLPSKYPRSRRQPSAPQLNRLLLNKPRLRRQGNNPRPASAHPLWIPPHFPSPFSSTTSSFPFPQPLRPHFLPAARPERHPPIEPRRRTQPQDQREAQHLHKPTQSQQLNPLLPNPPACSTKPIRLPNKRAA